MLLQSLRALCLAPEELRSIWKWLAALQDWPQYLEDLHQAFWPIQVLLMWLSLIPLWLEANNVFLRTSHFISLSSSWSLPQQQAITPEMHQQGESGSKLSHTASAVFHEPPAVTQQKCGHQSVHSDSANTVTENMNQNPTLTIDVWTESSTNKKQHGIGCEYIHSEVDGSQVTIKSPAAVCGALHDRFVAARNGKPPWSTKILIHSVNKLHVQDIVSCRIFEGELWNNYPQEWIE